MHYLTRPEIVSVSFVEYAPIDIPVTVCNKRRTQLEVLISRMKKLIVLSEHFNVEILHEHALTHFSFLPGCQYYIKKYCFPKYVCKRLFDGLFGD